MPKDEMMNVSESIRMIGSNCCVAEEDLRHTALIDKRAQRVLWQRQRAVKKRCLLQCDLNRLFYI